MRAIAAGLILVLVFCSEARSFELLWRAQLYQGRTAAELGLPKRNWCADFINMLLGGGTHSRAAISYAKYGSRASYGCTGCIAVLRRSRGTGHVGIVKGYDRHGNPIILSGNHNGVVGEGVYARRRVYALRQP